MNPLDRGEHGKIAAYHASPQPAGLQISEPPYWIGGDHGRNSSSPLQLTRGPGGRRTAAGRQAVEEPVYADYLLISPLEPIRADKLVQVEHSIRL